MAYDQGSYQPPQRPYNGRAAQRPGPPQSYTQAPPPQQQYDQYPQDGYGYNEYDNGYAQDYNDGYQDMNGGGRGNGYPPQQQEYHGDPNARGMPPPRGGGRGGHPPQQQRPPMGGYDPRAPPQGRGGGPPPRQRPPMDDRNFDQRGGRGGPGPQRGPDPRGGPGGFHNGGPPGGRGGGPGGGGGGGGRPPPPDRGFGSDPGQSQQGRRPLKTPPMSPDAQSWDNPFPTFPGAKKKTSVDEEHNILQKMEGMNIDGPSQNRPQTAGSKHGPNGFGPPGRAATYDDFGHPAGGGQRPPPQQNGYPQEPAKNYSNPQRGPQQGQPQAMTGNNSARNNAYWDPGFENGPTFAPPRSNTMPTDPMGGQPPASRMADGVGPSAAYNGPVGRNMPPRPSTATGARPPPQRTYPAPAPVAPQQEYADQYDQSDRNHRPMESISDLYDSYYEEPAGHYQGPKSGHSDMPNFDAAPDNHPPRRRGASIEGHIAPGPVHQPGGYQKPVQNQADYRAQAQPQAAVFESASDGGQTPTNAYFQQNQPGQNQYDDYGPPNGQYNQPRNGQYNQGPPNQGGYYEGSQNGFQPPPRSTSAAPRMDGYGPPPPAVGPKPVVNGLPAGPHPQAQNGMPRNNSAGSANGIPQAKLGEDALPSHPVPVRPGLIPGSVAAQNAGTKPAPVRNYNGNPNQGAAPAPAPAQALQQAVPGGPQPLTIGELEMVRTAAKAKPNDTAVQMLLVKKLVEASEVLVNSYPDVRMRNKMREKYVIDASKNLKRLVAANCTDAMFFLADCYGRGALGLENNDKEAFTLYQSAAKAGHAAAAYRTAVCCELGNEEGGGTRKDPTKAIQWYKRAATLGDTPAMYKMGMIQLKGLLGQTKNPRDAVQWLKRAAERADAENPHALHELGLLFEAPQSPDGSIVRDEVYSLSLFQQAAELGYKFSQFRLGCAFEYGLLGCPIDPRQSIAWYSRAAVQEEHQAELALSGWYLTGSEGVLQQSDTEAYLWARKAAMSGNAKAEYAMGYFTEVGIGSPSSLEDAKRWYWKAAAQDFPKARERLEELKKNGGKGETKPRERISRSKLGKQNEDGLI